MPKEATVVVDLSEKRDVWAYYKWFVFFEVLYFPHVTFCLSNCIEWIGLLLKIAKDWKVRQHVQQVIREAAVTRAWWDTGRFAWKSSGFVVSAVVRPFTSANHLFSSFSWFFFLLN